MLQRQHLLDLLVAQSAGVLQAAGAIGIGLRLGRIGLRLGHASPRHGDICQHAIGCKSRQYLAALHRLAHIDPHIIDPQALYLGAHTGFLPRVHAAIGRKILGQVHRLDQHGAHRQGRFGHPAAGRCRGVCGWRCCRYCRAGTLCTRGLGARAGAQGIKARTRQHQQQHGGQGVELQRHTAKKWHHRAFIKMRHGWGAGSGAGRSQPPPAARYSATHARLRSSCSASTSA